MLICVQFSQMPPFCLSEPLLLRTDPSHVEQTIKQSQWEQETVIYSQDIFEKAASI